MRISYVYIESRIYSKSLRDTSIERFQHFPTEGNYVIRIHYVKRPDFRGGGEGRGEENESGNTLLLWVKRLVKRLTQNRFYFSLCLLLASFSLFLSFFFFSFFFSFLFPSIVSRLEKNFTMTIVSLILNCRKPAIITRKPLLYYTKKSTKNGEM